MDVAPNLLQTDPVPAAPALQVPASPPTPLVSVAEASSTPIKRNVRCRVHVGQRLREHVSWSSRVCVRAGLGLSLNRNPFVPGRGRGRGFERHPRAQEEEE